MSTQSGDKQPRRLRLGKYGEELACSYLRANGYEILARNFRCHRYGEIDVIARRQGILSFIEVKTRATARFGRPVEAVTLSKQRKIYRCAEYYLQCAGLINCMPVLSFDVVEIIIEGTALRSIRHLPHCF